MHRERSDRAGWPRCSPCRRSRDRRRPRARTGARARHRSPGHQTGQHHGYARRRREDHGFRNREAHQGGDDHAGGIIDRHRRVYVARAGERRNRGSSLRYLVARRAPLRDARGTSSLWRGLRPGGDLLDLERSAEAAVRFPTGSAARARSRYHEGDGEVPRRALSDRRGHARGYRGIRTIRSGRRRRRFDVRRNGAGVSSLDRRASFQGYESQAGPGILLRGNSRGAPERPRPDRRAPCGSADFERSIQGQSDERAGHRQGAECPERPRGKRSKVRRKAPDYGAAHQRRGRLPSLLREVRPDRRRYLRDPGRDLPRHRGQAQGEAPAE